ncbi:short-chain dehydrogenase [Fusarium redolens]|uniref:Short-chain dehydrogenase n=1 Tax=Fusarium redolens TaxID=48865 RepID=A0A9P9HM05_FUSRE|nr:short-chain dehydrogenase [Fusarium redolens]KAH7258894.1 short-chain dehydrogenase [Fusarium redolens]
MKFDITGPPPPWHRFSNRLRPATASPRILILLDRSKTKYQSVIDKIHDINASVSVKFVETDFEFMANVRKAADTILADRDVTTIDALFNNAGVITNDLVRTPDGFESQFAINHLSHFLLTNMLMPRLFTSSCPKIVNISSLGHQHCQPTFQEPHFNNIDPQKYNPTEAYAKSKGAQVLFSVALNRRTNLKLETLMVMTQEIVGRSLEEANETLTKTSEGGCATGLTTPLELDVPNGVFMNDCEVPKDPELVTAWAQDAGKAEVCWRVSEGAVGQSFSFEVGLL